MAYVLGIDAAWTVTNPSGIALVSNQTNPPRLLRASPSFEDFVLGSSPDSWCVKPNFRASLSDVLKVTKNLGAASVEVIAVDMPLAREPIRAQRYCDHMVSSRFGARGCATHTPTKLRPGAVSDRLLQDATAAGFELVTPASRRPSNALLEVYPHAALLELCHADYRIPYKLARRRKYWPLASSTERLDKIKKSWNQILRCLRARIDFDFSIDCTSKTLQFWKAWEDVIDAVVCCWVGLEWLAGNARPYGDGMASIWVPEKMNKNREHVHDLA